MDNRRSSKHDYRRRELHHPKVFVLATSLCTLAFTTPEPWHQIYDPAGHLWLSTLLAGLPFIFLLVGLAVFRLKAHVCAPMAAALCLIVAIALFHMPAKLAFLAAAYGAAYGAFPIFWIIFPVIFLYQLTVKAGRFSLLHGCITGITQDSRLQLLVVAFALGAFFEGAAGFGTPVAVCGTLLIGFGFSPLRAAALALLANTAPVAFGGLGIPVVALAGITGLDLHHLTAIVATLLTPFCILVPFWLIWAFAGFAAMIEVWPAILVAGVTFGGTQLLIARIHGPWLVDISASAVSIAAMLLLFQFWQPRRILNSEGEVADSSIAACENPTREQVLRALLPWAILTAGVTLWGTPAFTHWLNSFSTFNLHVPGLDQAVLRVPPAVPQAAAEPAIFTLNLLSATGTGIVISAVIAAFAMGLRIVEILQVLRSIVRKTAYTLLTIAALMSIGFVSRYCGLDATLGLALAATGAFYTFFGTFIGWLGTASTGSDTSSNVLFGSLQTLTARQLGLSPFLMAAANSAGGVMAKMVSPQNVVVATTATGI
ncbi:MAG: L-lactate permease [Acidobacteriota bacterium]